MSASVLSVFFIFAIAFSVAAEGNVHNTCEISTTSIEVEEGDIIQLTKSTSIKVDKIRPFRSSVREGEGYVELRIMQETFYGGQSGQNRGIFSNEQGFNVQGAWVEICGVKKDKTAIIGFLPPVDSKTQAFLKGTVRGGVILQSAKLFEDFTLTKGHSKGSSLIGDGTRECGKYETRCRSARGIKAYRPKSDRLEVKKGDNNDFIQLNKKFAGRSSICGRNPNSHFCKYLGTSSIPKQPLYKG